MKERGQLILVPRETPYNTIHLDNMNCGQITGGLFLDLQKAFDVIPIDLILKNCIIMVLKILSCSGLKCT